MSLGTRIVRSSVAEITTEASVSIDAQHAEEDDVRTALLSRGSGAGGQLRLVDGLQPLLDDVRA